MIQSIILISHIVSSILAGIITFIIIYRAIAGLAFKKEADTWDLKLPGWTTMLLYIQFALGTILFVFYMIDYANGTIDLLQGTGLRRRFWPVEHFILMVFTLVISHIGWIFARNSKISKLIFKKNLLYFGVVCLMIMISMMMNMLRHTV